MLNSIIVFVLLIYLVNCFNSYLLELFEQNDLLRLKIEYKSKIVRFVN